MPRLYGPGHQLEHTFAWCIRFGEKEGKRDVRQLFSGRPSEDVKPPPPDTFLFCGGNGIEFADPVTIKGIEFSRPELEVMLMVNGIQRGHFSGPRFTVPNTIGEVHVPPNKLVSLIAWMNVERPVAPIEVHIWLHTIIRRKSHGQSG